MKPLFGPTGRRAAAGLAPAPGDAPAEAALSKYFRVEAPDHQLDSLAEQFRARPSVEAAYVKPPAEPAFLNDMVPVAADAPPVTPDLSSRQGYLDAAPGGVDARHAWTRPGGAGAGVRIIDIEGAWRFTHEDLAQNAGGVVGGAQSEDIGWRNHGTAVIGEFSGDRNPLGVMGLCPDANVRAVSIFGGLGSAGAIRAAADLLGPGDVILIELHRPGPKATGVGQQGYIAIEWWPDDYDAIRYATGRGVVVVEAAGNGAQDLDDPAYDVPDQGFPGTWSNPFRRGARDSGAVLVGAGAPPQGTHGRDWGPDRSRLDFSNYGAAVDAQGWGREVTTCGYGDLQGGANEDAWYTDQFSGTSSASPIVVGTLGCIQGALRAAGRATLTPAGARALLRSTGSPQQDAPGRPASQRIGSRPNLRQALDQLVGVGVTTVALHRYWNPVNADHFYTTDQSELGSGLYGWRYEGVQCYVAPKQAPDTVPLYRYWNADVGDHFYTTDWSELGGGLYGWHYEGVQCYAYTSPAPDRAPLYRYWSPAGGDHFYTTDWSELGSGLYGWHYEGVQCYVATTARPATAGEGAVAPPAEPTPSSFSVRPSAAGASQGPTGRGAPLMRAGAGFTAASLVKAGPPSTFLVDGPGDDLSGGRPASFATARAPAASFRRQGGRRSARITIDFGGDED